jgi:hypothetical protein
MSTYQPTFVATHGTAFASAFDETFKAADGAAVFSANARAVFAA